LRQETSLVLTIISIMSLNYLYLPLCLLSVFNSGRVRTTWSTPTNGAEI